MKKAMVIYNPTAGNESGGKYAKKLENKIIGDFDLVDLKQTQKPKDATLFASQACEEKYQAVFAIGGDGTVNEVINGMMSCPVEERPKLGIVPAGTFNGLSRVLNYPQNANRAIDNIDLSKIEPIDLATSNDDVFTFVFTIGDVAESIHNVTSEDKSKYSMFAYAVNMVRETIRNSHHDLVLNIDGRKIEGKFSHVVVTFATTLDQFRLVKNIDQRTDGKLHVFLYRNSNFFSQIDLIGKMIVGGVEKNHEVEYIKADNVYIESRDGSQVETDHDGDKAHYLPVDIKIYPSAIEVYTFVK